MEVIYPLVGLVGAACAVGMYALVAIGKISAEKPIFYLVNGIGAVLVLAAAAREFDIGDLGTIAQELIWAIVSFVGVARALGKRAPPPARYAVDVSPVRAPRGEFGLKPSRF